MAISPKEFAKRPPPLIRTSGEMPDDAWLTIRLATFPLPLANRASPTSFDPAIVRRLESGDAATALELALRKLRAAGIRPAIQFGNAPPNTARLWAAALAFPIHTTAAKRIHERLDPQSFKESAA